MYKPHIYVDSVLNIDYQKLKDQGIKLICFDLDNTLDYPDVMTETIIPEIEAKLEEVEALGFEIFIISNNSLPQRVESFAKIRNYPYLARAHKPFIRNYRHNEYLTKYPPAERAFVGDKVVTDIIGARRFGGVAILVDPLQAKPEVWYTIIMHYSEVIFNTIVGFKRGKYYDNM